MKILAIESSCDETAAAVVEDGRRICSNAVYSQMEEHRKFGGVVPEVASRRHTEQICAVTKSAMEQANIDYDQLDGVAVTAAPGLIGALLVGVSFAKGLALRLNVPLIPVHHISGHVAANYLAHEELKPPFLCLVASGGHSHIMLAWDYTHYVVLGRTRDDAAGEAFDKTGRAMGFPYPAGAALDEAAQSAMERRDKYPLPKPRVEGSPLDVSFSGLKTAVLNLLHNSEQKGEDMDIPALAASLQTTVATALVSRLEQAWLSVAQGNLPGEQHLPYGDSAFFLQDKAIPTMGKLPQPLPVVAAGGVCANSSLRSSLETMCANHRIPLYLPPLSLCGDNAAMIGAQAFYNLQGGITSPMDLNPRSR